MIAELYLLGVTAAAAAAKMRLLFCRHLRHRGKGLEHTTPSIRTL